MPRKYYGPLQPGKRSAYVPKTRRNKVVQKIARTEALKVVKRQSETKTSHWQSENVNLNHNTIHFHNNMLYTTTGTESGDRQGIVAVRIGDEMYLQSVRLRFWLSNKLDRPNVIYRVILYWYDVSSPPATQGDLFNAVGNCLLQTPNSENISVISDKIIKNVSSASVGASNNKERSTMYFKRKSWKNRKIVYNDNLSATPKNMSLGFAVMCYDAYGTLTTDNIASFSYAYDVKLKEN